MWMIVFITIVSATGAEECPRLCDCKWRSGKSSTVCIQAYLTKVPAQLDPATQLLDLTSNELLSIGVSAFSSVGLIHLQRLYLSKCSIGTLDPMAFNGLENLDELDLSYNFLENVPTYTFSPIEKLRQLILSGNPIKKIHDEAFRGLPNLVRLTMNNCNISDITPRAFIGIESTLQFIDLSHNNLQIIYVAALAPLRILNSIELAYNPWDCSCALRSLREWMIRKNLPMTVVPDCTSPSRLTNQSWDRIDLNDFACKPEVTAKKKKLRGVEGEEVIIVCRVLGVPAPRVRWTRAGRLLANTSTNVNSIRAYMLRSEGQTSNLIIKSAEIQDTGSYTCSAENRAGRTEAVINLIIDKKPPYQPFGGGAVIAGVAVSAVILLSLCVVGLCIRETRKKNQLVRWNEQIVTCNQRDDSYEKVDASHISNVGVPILPSEGGRTRGYYRNVPSNDPEDHYAGYVGDSARAEVETPLTPSLVSGWRQAEYEPRNVRNIMPERDLHIPRLSDYNIRNDDISASVLSSNSIRTISPQVYGEKNRFYNSRTLRARLRPRDRFENDTSGSDSDKNYPDLIEMSDLGPPYLRGGLKHDSYNFYTMPRRKGDSSSPLLNSRRNSSGGDSVTYYERTYDKNRYRAPERRSNSFLDLSTDSYHIYRNPSLPTSPTKAQRVPSTAPLPNASGLRDFSLTQPTIDDSDFRASQLEKFLEEYRSLTEQFSRVQETRENLQRSQLVNSRDLRMISKENSNVDATEGSSFGALADAASPLVLGSPEYRSQQPTLE